MYVGHRPLFVASDIIKKIWVGKCETIGKIVGGKRELSFRNSVRNCRGGA